MHLRSARLILIVLASVFVVPCLGQSNDRRQVLPAGGTLPAVFEYAPIDTLPTNDAASMAISADGTQLAFVALDDGRNRLWVQDIATGEARVLPGTDEARWPFFSPDGRHLGYFGNDQVKRVDIATGETQVLVSGATWGAGGSWGPDGTIVYGRHGMLSIQALSADGQQHRGTAWVSITGSLAQFHPFFLPDGEHFLFFVEGPPDVQGIYVNELADSSPAQSIISLLPPELFARSQPGEARRLVDADARGVYALGRLFFVKGGTLFAQAFDLDSLTLSGTPEAVAYDIPTGGRNGVALTAMGDQVIYRTGPAGAVQQLTWFDRRGNALGTVGEPFATGAGAVSLSPDGTRVVVNRYVNQLGDIFVVDVASGSATQVTDFPANNSYPIWSHDGQSVLFSSNRTVGYQVYRRMPLVDAEAELVFQTSGWQHPMDWSRDGRYLVYRKNSPDLWVLDTESGAHINVVSSGSGRIRWPQISPDGRWLAYQLDGENGNSTIHLHGPFAPPGTGRRSAPISIDGGGWVRWNAQGHELFYAAPDGSIMAVGLSFDADGNGFTAAAPEKLFTVPMAMGSLNRSIGQQYMVDASGQRFLVLVAAPAESPVHVLGP